MNPDSTIISISLKELKDWISIFSGLIGILGGGGLIGLLVLFIDRILPKYRSWRNERLLQSKFSTDLFSEGVIRQSTQFYIEPFCQNLDPARTGEPDEVYAAQEKLFSAMDRFLQHPSQYRFTILLADSGMGKTSALLNYCVYNLRREKS